MSDFDVDLPDEVGTSGGIPESETTEAISAPTKDKGRGALAIESQPDDTLRPLRTVDEVKARLAALPDPKKVSKAKPKREAMGDGRCRAYAPRGTKCKLCGKVHP